MNRQFQKLSRDYAKSLKKYLANEQEAGLEEAYGLGRRAIAGGVGVLEMARLHQHSLGGLLQSNGTNNHDRSLRLAETFFLETLSPFEVTHRGFRETNERLQQRNVELAEANKELEAEIAQRKRTENALRDSEEHLRQLFNEARRMEENLRNLSNQILHAQEEERKRISRELHDEVGQALTAISVTLATLEKKGSAASKKVSNRLTDAQRLIHQTMETVHSFARELRPTMLDELGLVPALRSFLKSYAERTGLHVRLHGDECSEQLSGEQKTVLFRVAQESLTNVARHAHASRVQVAIRKAANGICMTIEDNGRSFRYDAETSGKIKKRLGLLGMQERVRLVNGEFAIDARPGKGTTVRVTLPANT